MHLRKQQKLINESKESHPVAGQLDLFSMVGKPLPTSSEDGIPEVLKAERMGHEMPRMHGVYGHVSPAMRAVLKAALQERWESSVRERAQLCPRSIVPVLDRILTGQREASVKIGSRLAPKIGHRKRGSRALDHDTSG